MHTTIKCIGEHDDKGEHTVEVNLLDSLFDRGPFIISCPECEKRYIVYGDGHYKLFRHNPLKFLAIHY